MGVYIHAYLWLEGDSVAGIGQSVTEAENDARKSLESSNRMFRQIGKEMDLDLRVLGLDGRPILIAINGDDAASAHNAYQALARALRSETYEPRNDAIDAGPQGHPGRLVTKLPDPHQGPEGNEEG